LEGYQPGEEWAARPTLLINRWILARLARAIGECNRGIDEFRVDEASSALYHFFWDELCDWYIEATKPIFNGDNEAERVETIAVLSQVIETALRAMHPFMPFVTEELWQRVPRPSSRPASIARAPYPAFTEGQVDADAERQMRAVMDVISVARSIRNEHDLHPSAAVPVVLRCGDPDVRDTLTQQTSLIQFLVRTAGPPQVCSADVERPAGSVLAVAGVVEVLVVLRGVVDADKERDRVERSRKKLLKDEAILDGRLKNPKFIEKAPPEVIAEVQEQLQALTRQLQQLDEALEIIEELR
jgi:valyl-tRNA synthetase